MTPPPKPAPEADSLKKRRLGRTGIYVTELGIGGAHLSAEDSGEEALLEAFRLGVNFVETGRAYKGSEYLIGGALIQSPNRGEIHVASKTLARSRDGALGDLERSLNHLRLQAIDVYQLNSVEPGDWAQAMGEGGALQGLQEARERGLVRFIGISSHSPSVLRRAIESNEFDTVQVKWGAFHAGNASIIRMASERDIGVIGMKPFGGFGMFGSLKGSEFERLLSAASLLRFALSSAGLSVCIPGVRKSQEVRENVRTATSGRELDDEDRSHIVQQAKAFLKTMRVRA
jgi:aryl-alcohol dehydrogenase-like predicted oxidoreductase